MPKIKVKGQMVQTGECPQQMDTHTHTHMDATKHIISLAMWSIKINKTTNRHFTAMFSNRQLFTNRAEQLNMLQIIVPQQTELLFLIIRFKHLQYSVGWPFATTE